MHLTLDRGALLRALTVTARVVERRNTVPILSNVRLGTEGQALTIRATDLDIEAASSCEAEVETPGAITVPAQTLRDIVAKLPEGAPVTLQNGGEGRMRLSAGRARFNLGTLPIEDYPDLQAGEMSHSFQLPTADAARLVRDLSFAISTEETRYYLNGVYWHAPAEADRQDGLVGVATDGHRLARLRLPRPPGAEGMPGVILPRKFVGEMGKLAEADGEAFLSVDLSTTKVRVRRDQTVLTSKLIDGTFPDYARVIPTANGKHAQVDGKAMAAALDRVTTVSSERGRAVRLEIEAERIGLMQHTPDSGEGHEDVDATFDADPMTIGFNGRYLHEILTLLDTEQAELLLNDHGSPTILRRRDDEVLTVVLMPMRA